MTREELITSDEYIIVTIECIITSRKPIKKIRKELSEFFLKYRDEIISLNKKP